MSGSWRIESGSISGIREAVDLDVELAGFFVEFEMNEVAAVCHPGDIFESTEVDADDAAVGLVGLKGGCRQREVDHPDVGRVDGADGELRFVQPDLTLVNQHAHRVKRVLERVSTHDGLEHAAGYESPDKKTPGLHTVSPTSGCL